MKPENLEREHTLVTAGARFDDLRMRDALADDGPGGAPPLTRDAALETLA